MSWETNPWKPTEDGVILRNTAGISNKDELNAVEYVHIQANMKKALSMLQMEKEITLNSWQRCHAILFSEIYPWAGKIRHLDARKGYVPFNLVNEIESSTAEILKDANDAAFFSENLGEVYSKMAFNHPFLDGNGRSLNAVCTELARRSGFGIAWDEVDKQTYLSNLTSGVMFMMYDPMNAYLDGLKVPLEHYDPESRLTKAHRAA